MNQGEGGSADTVGGENVLEQARRVLEIEAGAIRALADRLGIADRVHFAGPVADPERWMAAADLFVLPTIYDPFSNACLEAMASGLPVITTTANGVAEIMEEWRTGAVVPDPRDVAGLADRMAEFLDPARRQERAAAARACAEAFPKDNIGDVLCTTPALRALHRAFPGAHLTILVAEHCRAAVERNPDPDEVLAVARAALGAAITTRGPA